MKVKICGIKSSEAAEAAYKAGADYLGFVFAKSKRNITAEQAAQIVTELPPEIKTAGIFVNETEENIVRIAGLVKLDYIQLHGNESPEFCKSMPLPVIKAFSIKEKSDLEKLSAYDCDYYLLDSPGGGTGIPFDWSLLNELPVPRGKIILAGGLNEKNVAEAIKKIRPAIVDVSSGVETEGLKDLKKITAFINKAKFEEREEDDSLHITR